MPFGPRLTATPFAWTSLTLPCESNLASWPSEVLTLVTCPVGLLVISLPLVVRVKVPPFSVLVVPTAGLDALPEPECIASVAPVWLPPEAPFVEWLADDVVVFAAGAAARGAGAELDDDLDFCASARLQRTQGNITARNAVTAMRNGVVDETTAALRQIINPSTTYHPGADLPNIQLLNVAYFVVHENDLHILVNIGLLLSQIDHLLWHAQRL